MATILVVDDRPSNRAYLLALLGFSGHRTLQASDGAEALALVRRERPELVITDILMPAMDGYQFVRRLRADPQLAATRVIFYSAVYAEPETAAMARSCGVSTVLGKPADQQRLLDAVATELGERATAPLPPRQAPPPVPDASAAPERRSALLEDLCLRLAGERDPATLADTFIHSTRELLDADAVALCLLAGDEQQPAYLRASGFDAAVLEAAALDRDSLPGSLLEAERPLHCPDCAPVAARLPAGHPPCGSFLGVPVRDAHNRHGWMYALRVPGRAAFSGEDERFAARLAAHLAVAYANLNLYQLVQRHAAQLQLEATARERADAVLRETEHRLVLARQVFDSTAESIMMTDACANIVAVNPAFEQITGYREQDVIGENPRILRSGRHDACYFRAMWDDLSVRGQWRGEIWNRRKNGEIYPERISISAVRDHNGKVKAYVSVSSDLSALKAAHHQLDFLANHDGLTGLPNRSLFYDRLQQALAAARQGGTQFALLMFNIDRLQRINDSLGHTAGDAMLREVAQRVARIAGPTDTVARLDSDDFVMLLTACEDTEDIIVTARKLSAAVSEPISIGGHDVVLTASVGISIYPRDGTNPGALLKAADMALTEMKDAGRNGFRFFKGEMNVHALRWLKLESHLRRAIAKGALTLHYQPQVSARDGRVVGMEALVRWHSEELGHVPPSEFIPLAEDTGLILQIGEWVLHEACRQVRAWREAGLAPVRVAVNVSAQQFMAGNLAAVVRAALHGHGMHASCLEIELTESVMMGDAASAQAQLAELRALGVTVSLDDFGTGYASLGYLSRLTLDKLKIDQSFVRDINAPRSAAIAQATVALAQGLSLAVVAEGVETAEQRDYLCGIGCDIQQGYLYSRPLPAEAIAALLEAGAVAV